MVHLCYVIPIYLIELKILVIKMKGSAKENR